MAPSCPGKRNDMPEDSMIVVMSQVNLERYRRSLQRASEAFQETFRAGGRTRRAAILGYAAYDAIAGPALDEWSRRQRFINKSFLGNK